MDSSGADSPEIQKFGMSEVDRVPEGPGIYAWYAKFRAGKYDWMARPENGQDAAIESFLDLIRHYASYYEPLPINLKGAAPYGGLWSGSLELDHGVPRSVVSSAKGDPLNEILEKDRDALEAAISSESSRQILAELLSGITPVFSAPLYIGVAENLQSRLKKHRATYTSGIDWLADHPEGAEELRSKANSFGLRAAARGIAMEHLEVWVIDLEAKYGSENSIADLRVTARSAEWLLHRLFSPILGRQ
ncbi:hypothetical protein QYS60_20110 [Rhodococcus sp. GXMU-t2271]|uniref:hypothetical protein n=1 Tax=Rhodococcus sp. GXMU-t2271 TaxID=3059079 RepID=UPI00352AAF94